jgi:hypothetical protein
MDGGTLRWDASLNVNRALVDAMRRGIGKFVAKGSYGIVMKLTAPDKEDFPFTDLAEGDKVRTLIVKVIPMTDLKFVNDRLRGTAYADFKKEYNTHKLLDVACKKHYGFSIFPTPIKSAVAPIRALMDAMPFFKQLMYQWGLSNTADVGIIFMETANSKGKSGTLSDRSPRQMRLCRRLLLMMATLGYVHGDFHDGNFFTSANGFVIGDLGEARPMTPKEIELMRKALPLTKQTKPLALALLYGFGNEGKDFTSTYFEPRPNPKGDEETRKYNAFAKRYQWVRSEDRHLHVRFDDVDIASLKDVERSLGF